MANLWAYGTITGVVFSCNASTLHILQTIYEKQELSLSLAFAAAATMKTHESEPENKKHTG